MSTPVHRAQMRWGNCRHHGNAKTFRPRGVNVLLPGQPPTGEPGRCGSEAQRSRRARHNPNASANQAQLTLQHACERRTRAIRTVVGALTPRLVGCRVPPHKRVPQLRCSECRRVTAGPMLTPDPVQRVNWEGAPSDVRKRALGPAGPGGVRCTWQVSQVLPWAIWGPCS